MILRNYQQELIAATRQAFSTHNRPLVVLPCGGGKTICFADMASLHIAKSYCNYVWFLVHRQELVKQTLDTFKEFNIPSQNVFVGMVQTVARHIEKYKTPTMIIFDEAHHATANTWKKIIDYFPDVPIIGLTATPLRLDGKGLGGIFDTLIIGVTSDWLIKNHYLCEYDYYAPKIVEYNFETKGDDFDLEQVTDFFETSCIYGDTKKFIDDNRKIIIYSPSVRFSKHLVAQIPGAVHFDGDTPEKERQQIVADFKSGKTKVLSNVNLIGEGFDVPDCDCVILLRPTQSLALYIQQSMRCLRPKPSKRAVIYDLVGNVYRHGMPTDDHEWGLSASLKCRNVTAVEELLVRECKKCYRVYKGTKSVCPYCGFDNGKTRQEIKQQKDAELQKIEEINKKDKRMEIGRARSLENLIQLGIERGYKNPRYWAMQIMRSRNNKYKGI